MSYLSSRVDAVVIEGTLLRIFWKKLRKPPLLFVVPFVVFFLSTNICSQEIVGPSEHRQILKDATYGEWIRIPNTKLKHVLPPEAFERRLRYSGGPKNIVNAWNGASIDNINHRIDLIAGGGHADYAGNQHLAFHFDTLQWELVRAASDPGDDPKISGKTGIAPDGFPASRHTYGGTVYIPSIDKHLLIGGALVGIGTADDRAWLVGRDGSTVKIFGEGKWTSLGHQVVYDSVTDKVYYAIGGNLYALDVYAKTKQLLTPRQASFPSFKFGIAIDESRRNVVMVGGKALRVFNIDTKVLTKYTLTDDQLPLANCTAPGFDYVPDIDKYVGWCGGGNLYLMDPDDLNVTIQRVKGAAPKKNTNGVFGRFAYSTKYKGIFVIDAYDADVAFVKLFNSKQVISRSIRAHEGGSGVARIRHASLGVLPIIAVLSKRTEVSGKPPVVHGAVGGREEIGLFTEWQSEFLATGRLKDHIIWQADSWLDAPWCDLKSITLKSYAGGEYSLSFAHTPNLFFLPYLLTKDKKYIAPMECQWKIYQEWRNRQPLDGAIRNITGRDLAWQLRNLAELAYLQKAGVTQRQYYSAALQATLEKLWADTERWPNKGFNVLAVHEVTKGNRYWSGWIEDYLHLTLNHILQLGFKEWRPLVEWHFQHFIGRCGGEWALKYCTNDHVFRPGDGWHDTLPYEKKRIDALASWPDNKLPTNRVNGIHITYSNRAESVRGAVAIAASNGIKGAVELEKVLSDQLEKLGGRRLFKFNFEADSN